MPILVPLSDVQHIADEIGTVVSGYDGRLLHCLDRIQRIRLEAIARGDRELWRIAAVEMFQNDSNTQDLYRVIDATAHDMLQLLLIRATEFGELRAQAPLELLADTIFSLSQFNVSRYMLDPDITLDGAASHLDAQIGVLLTPYLEPR